MKDKEEITQYRRSIAFALLMGTIFNYIGLAILILKWGGVDYLSYMFGDMKPGLVWFAGGAVVGALWSYLNKPKS